MDHFRNLLPPRGGFASARPFPNVRRGMKNDLRGQRFGRLTALEPTDRRSRGCLVWRCRCDCGAEVEVESRRLKPGAMLSCGCKEKPPSDLTGCRFGKLVVLEKTEKRAANRAVIWRCRCDCGAETEVPRDKLLSGQKTSFVMKAIFPLHLICIME